MAVWKPSGVSLGVRTTLQGIFSRVPACSRTILVSVGRFWRNSINAPWEFTLSVMASKVVGFPFNAT
jgi:hypothetical protein